MTGGMVFPEDSWWAFCDGLFESLVTGAGPGWGAEVLQPWLAANPETLRALHRVGEPGMAAVALEDEDSWTLYALSRVVDLLLDPADAAARPAYRDFRAAIGAEFPAADGFHPFLHEIVEVEPADDPEEPPSLVAELWPGSLVGSMVLARAGVRVRAGANHLDPRVATTSPMLWAWTRRRRPAMDLSHGWGHNSQWRTDFRRDYLLPDRLVYNADAALSPPVEQFGPGLPDAVVVELVRHRCSLRVAHDPDEGWVWARHHSEPRGPVIRP